MLSDNTWSLNEERAAIQLGCPQQRAVGDVYTVVRPNVTEYQRGDLVRLFCPGERRHQMPEPPRLDGHTSVDVDTKGCDFVPGGSSQTKDETTLMKLCLDVPTVTPANLDQGRSSEFASSLF